MKVIKYQKPIIAVATATLLLIMLVLGTATASRSYAQGGGVLRQSAAAGTAFTYQGRLIYNGTPITGTCDLTFRLYDSAGAGAVQIGSNQVANNTPVNDGFFTVSLDFGSDAFSGDARYLQIAIDSCDNGASNVTLPRIELTAVPYALTALNALSLQPGAVITGEVMGGAVLEVGNTYNPGMFASYGIQGAGDTAGVYGVTTAASGTPYGVYGVASDSGSATSYGVYGESKSSVGTGVGGVAPRTGVYGEASGTSGATYGVYGKSNSGSGYGVYSYGNAHVEGQLTWKPITSYLSIPAAAFVPQYNYEDKTYNAGSIVRTLDGSPHTVFNAPVQLPHGATVTGMTIYWRDDLATGDGTVDLYRSNFHLLPISMATASTTGDSGVDSSSSTSSISYNPIDNSSFTYYLSARLPYESGGSAYVGLYGVVISYTIAQPY